MRGKLAVAAALLSAGAAAIHASVAGPHFDEYAPYGFLFAVTALAQAAWAALVILAPSGPVFAAGIAGNAGIVAVWALSRTTGLPFGPHAWSPEPAGRLDVTATALELSIVLAGCLVLAARDDHRRLEGEGPRFAAAAAGLVAAVTVAFAVQTGTGHDHAGAATASAAHHHGPVAAATDHGSRPRGVPDAQRRSGASGRARERHAKRPVGAPVALHVHAHHTHGP